MGNISEIDVIFNYDDLIEHIISEVYDKLSSDFPQTHAGEFIEYNADRVDAYSVATKITEKLIKSKYVTLNAISKYTISKDLVNEYLYYQLKDLDDEIYEVQYFDINGIPEIDEIINDFIDEAYENLNLAEEFNKAYNRYIREEIEG